MTKVYKVKYEETVAQGNTQMTLQIAKALVTMKETLDAEEKGRDFIIKEVTDGLNSYKNRIREQVNNLRCFTP